MAKVRIVNAINNDNEITPIFVYRGYYGRVHGTAAYHTSRILRNGVKLADIPDNDVFHMDSGRFATAKDFKNIVDDHIKYIYSAFSSLDYYFSLNS